MMLSSSPTQATQYVLVLHDGQEKDVLGIWGPYRSEMEAKWAMDELNLWPINGLWDMVPLKHFAPPSSQTTTYSPHTVNWTDRGVHLD